MADDPRILQKTLEDAAKRTSATLDVIRKESEENIRAYERFYNNLALFSGGTIALSMTYLGYLKGLSRPVLDRYWLIASWSSLLASLMLSVFYSFFHTHYSHYAREREFRNNLAEQRTAEAELVDAGMVVSLPADEARAYAKKLREASGTQEKEKARAARWEDFYFFTWRWGGFLARLGFFVGLCFLFLFAVANL